MTYNLTPMQVCERLIGKPEAIGLAAGLGEKAAYHWRNSRKGRAAGDLPAASVMRALLVHAAARGIPLTADHLIWGASEDELAALVSGQSLAVPRFASQRHHIEAAE